MCIYIPFVAKIAHADRYPRDIPLFGTMIKLSQELAYWQYYNIKIRLSWRQLN